MAPNLKLSIPQPCSQKWNNFKPVSTGGYCSSCEKVVKDFTQMSDEEIINFFKTKQSHICGRFNPAQLKTYGTPPFPTIKPGVMLLRAGLISALLMFVPKPTSAQQSPVKADTVLVEDKGSINPTETIGSRFTGIVRDETGSPLPGVNVWLKGTSQGTTTDIDGNFVFSGNLKTNDVLVFSFIGYSYKEITIKSGDEKGFNVPLQLCMDADIMGELTVQQLYQEPSAFGKFIARIGKLF